MKEDGWSPRRRFLSALYGGRSDRVPVGSPTSVATLECMDESHAHFPEVHLDGEKMAVLAMTAHTVLGYDCVMPVFSIQQEAAALGCSVDWGTRETMPVERSHPLEEPAQLRIPHDFLERPSIRTVLEALALLKRELGMQVAIVGKVMGPWTLSYHLHGLQEFLIKTKLEPDLVHSFLHRLKEVTVLFGKAQIAAGADVLCIADHATGDLVGPGTYRDFLLPIHKEIVARLHCPSILHICGNTLDRLPYIKEAGFDAFHFDSKVNASAARGVAGNSLSLIGNINNPEVLLTGTRDDAFAAALQAIEAGVDLVGPECAVPLATPNVNLMAVAEAAKQRAGKC
jgi:MtaA/CmuA family methyltransferase